MTITRGYCTLVEFQAKVGLTSDQLTNKTTLIEREIERNSRSIDLITGNIFYQLTLTNSKVICGFGVNSDGLRLSEDRTRIYFPAPIISLSSVVDDGTTLTADEDYYQGYDFIEAAGTFTSDRADGIKITGSCGYTSTPDEVNQVCLTMSEVTTGLGTYTVVDADGTKTDITRDNMPEWVADRLYMHTRMDTIG